MRRMLFAIATLGAVVLGPVLYAQHANAMTNTLAAGVGVQSGTSLAEPVVCRRVCNRRGCWTKCSGPAYVAPVAPLVVAPAVPVCRSVRVCDWRGCFWRRRCY